MLRLPSLQRSRDDYYSGDPAYRQLPDDATDEQRAEHAKAIEVARDTGDWRPLLVEGGNPTSFQMRPIPGNMFRLLMDHATAGKCGAAELAALCFRAAIRGVTNWGEVKVELVSTQFGEMASTKIVDELDLIDKRIVTELGGEALTRARVIAPKS